MADTTTPPAPGDSTGEPALATRVDGLEAEQKRQGGILEQILAKLPGAAPNPAAAARPMAPQESGSIAQMVRDGIAELEAKKAAAADADANRTAREEHEARLKALEERTPAETADSAPGRLRATVQRVVFGIDTPAR
jgi:hypothetical protein